MYLREMGTVPLLTREGEVEIARRIERGQNTVLKSLARAPLAIQEIIGMGEEMARDTISARDVVQIAEPILTDELVEESATNLCAPPRKSRASTARPCSAGRSCRPLRAP